MKKFFGNWFISTKWTCIPYLIYARTWNIKRILLIINWLEATTDNFVAFPVFYGLPFVVKRHFYKLPQIILSLQRFFWKKVVRLSKPRCRKGLQPVWGCQRLTEVDRVFGKFSRELGRKHVSYPLQSAFLLVNSRENWTACCNIVNQDNVTPYIYYARTTADRCTNVKQKKNTKSARPYKKRHKRFVYFIRNV